MSVRKKKGKRKLNNVLQRKLCKRHLFHVKICIFLFGGDGGKGGYMESNYR